MAVIHMCLGILAHLQSLWTSMHGRMYRHTKCMCSFVSVDCASINAACSGPRFDISACSGLRFDNAEAFINVNDLFENVIVRIAACRYERGLHTVGTGSLVRQKHAATKAEGMVAQGSRLVVRGNAAEREESDAKLLVPPTVTHPKSNLL
jgi:hypothetical protein